MTNKIVQNGSGALLQRAVPHQGRRDLHRQLDLQASLQAHRHCKSCLCFPLATRNGHGHLSLKILNVEKNRCYVFVINVPLGKQYVKT